MTEQQRRYRDEAAGYLGDLLVDADAAPAAGQTVNIGPNVFGVGQCCIVMPLGANGNPSPSQCCTGGFAPGDLA